MPYKGFSTGLVAHVFSCEERLDGEGKRTIAKQSQPVPHSLHGVSMPYTFSM